MRRPGPGTVEGGMHNGNVPPGEWARMVRGELYDPLDADLVRRRRRARDLCQDLNAIREAHVEERRRLLRELFGRGGDTVWLQPPFFCDYGANILLGERVFFNFNCVVLDVAPVTIGDHMQIPDDPGHGFHVIPAGDSI